MKPNIHVLPFVLQFHLSQRLASGAILVFLSCIALMAFTPSSLLPTAYVKPQPLQCWKLWRTLNLEPAGHGFVPQRHNLSSTDWLNMLTVLLLRSFENFEPFDHIALELGVFSWQRFGSPGRFVRILHFFSWSSPVASRRTVEAHRFLLKEERTILCTVFHVLINCRLVQTECFWFRKRRDKR